MTAEQDDTVTGAPAGAVQSAAAAGTERDGAGASSPLRGDVWDTDRMNHLHDLPRFCPDCGSTLQETGGMATEYWTADRRVYHVWCRPCGWVGDVTRIRRMVGPDSPH